ncbi:MAG: ribosome maturation factor RimM [Christensenellales bacterium]
MDMLKIGLILKPQGINGELKIQPLTDDEQRYNRLPYVFLETKGGYDKRSFSHLRLQNGFVYLLFEGVNDRDTAEALRGRYLYIDRQHAVELPEGSYFICDLIGCVVEDENGFEYGKVTEVLQTGANDVYVVSGIKELYLPALKKLILSTDIEAKRIMIRSDVLKEVALHAD